MSKIEALILMLIVQVIFNFLNIFFNCIIKLSGHVNLVLFEITGNHQFNLVQFHKLIQDNVTQCGCHHTN